MCSLVSLSPHYTLQYPNNKKANEPWLVWLRAGTGLGCGPGPQLGACERQPIDMFLSLSFSFPSLLSKK